MADHVARNANDPASCPPPSAPAEEVLEDLHVEMATPIGPGLMLAEKFRLVSPLGEGAMGEVWRAEHVGLGHSVAIKILALTLGADTDARRRFDQEARVSAKLGELSTHVVKVYDSGIVDQRPYLVMEVLEGESLAKRLERIGRFSLVDTARIVDQLARALAIAHARGVVHRDIKPGNIMLLDGGSEQAPFVKLLDFGVAKVIAENQEPYDMTARGVIVGTPGFMSPEQFEGTAVDARSDLFSLAAVAYRMITGRRPFGRGTLAQLAVDVVSRPHVRPTSIHPELPPELDAWFNIALAKEASQRFGSARELASELLAVAGEPEAGSSQRLHAGISGLSRTTLERPRGLPLRTGSGQARTVIPLVGSLLLLLVGAVALVLRTRTEHAADVRAATTPTVLSDAAVDATSSGISDLVYRVMLYSEPAGASVSWDGRVFGVTPLALELRGASQMVTLAKDGYMAESIVVDPPAGTVREIERTVSLRLTVGSSTAATALRARGRPVSKPTGPEPVPAVAAVPTAPVVSAARPHVRALSDEDLGQHIRAIEP